MKSRVKLITNALVFIFVASISLNAASCEDGYWVKSVSDGGRIVVLQDNSVWEVESIDQIDSTLWLSGDEIIVCDDRLINTDDGTTVYAKRLR